MFSRLLSGLLVSAMLLGSALTAQAQQTLNFGIISPQGYEQGPRHGSQSLLCQ